MPKKTVDFPEQINFLAPKGTQELLVAIAYYRGNGNRFAGPARDFIDRGIRDWIEALTPKERRRFDEILENVRITRNLLE